VIRESGGPGLGDGGEPTAAWPEAFSPCLSPFLTASRSRPLTGSRDHARSQRGARPESPHAARELIPHPVTRTALRGHVALRHLPPRDPE
jgi:hypothetical protein